MGCVFVVVGFWWLDVWVGGAWRFLICFVGYGCSGFLGLVFDFVLVRIAGLCLVFTCGRFVVVCCAVGSVAVVVGLFRFGFTCCACGLVEVLFSCWLLTLCSVVCAMLCRYFATVFELVVYIWFDGVVVIGFGGSSC